MPDPVLVAIAAALAGKAAVTVASSGASALRSMFDLVKRKFAAEPGAANALEAARAEPEDSERIDALTRALEEATRRDPQFAEQLRALWGEARSEQRADRGGVINEVSGTVGGHVVQARDITGGVSFGEPPRRDNP